MTNNNIKQKAKPVHKQRFRLQGAPKPIPVTPNYLLHGFFAPPGSGKTSKNIQIASIRHRNKQRSLTLLPNHDVIREIIKPLKDWSKDIAKSDLKNAEIKIKEAKINQTNIAQTILEHKKLKKSLSKSIIKNKDIRHLEGLERLCSSQKMKDLYKSKIPSSMVCQICRMENKNRFETCKYTTQFKNLPFIVFAPEQYIPTHIVSGFKYIIWDEADPFKCYKVFKLTNDEIKNLRNLLNLCQLNSDLTKLKYGHWKNELIKLLSGGTHKDIIELIILIWKYLSWESHTTLYPNLSKKNGMMRVPYCFRLFDLVVEGIEVSVMAANSMSKYWKIKISQYGKNIILYTEPVEKALKKSLVIRFDEYYKRGDRAYKSFYWKNWYPSPQTKEKIQTLMTLHPRVKFGLVTHKKWINSFEYLNIPILSFGSLRSSNELKDCHVMFVVGTFQTTEDTIREHYIDMYNKEPNLKQIKTDVGRIYCDSDVAGIAECFNEEEMYQAIFRCRPLNWKRIIYLFGKLPPGIKEDIETVHQHRFRDWFDNLIPLLDERDINWSNFVDKTKTKYRHQVEEKLISIGFGRKKSRRMVRKAIKSHELHIVPSTRSKNGIDEIWYDFTEDVNEKKYNDWFDGFIVKIKRKSSPFPFSKLNYTQKFLDDETVNDM